MFIDGVCRFIDRRAFAPALVAPRTRRALNVQASNGKTNPFLQPNDLGLSPTDAFSNALCRIGIALPAELLPRCAARPGRAQTNAET